MLLTHNNNAAVADFRDLVRLWAERWHCDRAEAVRLILNHATNETNEIAAEARLAEAGRRSVDNTY